MAYRPKIKSDSNGTLVDLPLDAETLQGKNPSSFANATHLHAKSDISDFPYAMPASDVYSWAKATKKPTYTASEVGAAPLTTIKDNAINGVDIMSTSDGVRSVNKAQNAFLPFRGSDFIFADGSSCMQKFNSINAYGADLSTCVRSGGLDNNWQTMSFLYNWTNTAPAQCGSVPITDGPIGTCWYNFMWIPHRNGLGASDNSDYGQLFLFPMTSGMTVNDNFWWIRKNVVNGTPTWGPCLSLGVGGSGGSNTFSNIITHIVSGTASALQLAIGSTSECSIYYGSGTTSETNWVVGRGTGSIGSNFGFFNMQKSANMATLTTEGDFFANSFAKSNGDTITGVTYDLLSRENGNCFDYYYAGGAEVVYTISKLSTINAYQYSYAKAGYMNVVVNAYQNYSSVSKKVKVTVIMSCYNGSNLTSSLRYRVSSSTLSGSSTIDGMTQFAKVTSNFAPYTITQTIPAGSILYLGYYYNVGQLSSTLSHFSIRNIIVQEY